MTPEILWQHYAATWSLDPLVREAALATCLAEDVTYCDPNGLIEGRASLSAYMDGFQQAVAGGRFEIRNVLQHHDRTMADWVLRVSDDSVVQSGTSFGLLSADGRLRTITGFFRQSDGRPEP